MKITPSFSYLKKYLLIKLILIVLLTSMAISAYFLYFYYNNNSYYKYQTTSLTAKLADLTSKETSLSSQLAAVEKEFTDFKSQDQVKRNNILEEEIKNIHNTYLKTVTSYEELVKLKEKNVKTGPIDNLYAQTLKLLSDKNYSSASSTLVAIDKKIKEENDKLQQQAAAVKIPENVPVNNTPPSSGYRRQQVQVDSGSFMVDIITADLNSTKVIVDTASNSDCTNDCPVLSLGDYVSRNGAFAGINGAYFCPATYPSCAGKTNSFDTLLMNKNKVYFNSTNNVYSTVPAVIFSGNSARFVTQSLQWGRDTGVDSVIANYPLLTFNGQNIFGGSGDTKHTGRGPRGFVGSTNNTVYIGVVSSATVGDAAKVLQALGIRDSLNLDSGGSTALWSGGYKAGPGRNIPNAILFVRK